MALINRPDLVEKLRAAFGVVQGMIGSTLSDELVGVVIVDDVSGADVVSTQHPVNAMGHGSASAEIGFFSKVGLQNPFGSGVDIFLNGILLRSSVIVSVNLRQGVIPGLPGFGDRLWRDLRVVGSPAGVVWDENLLGTLGERISRIQLIVGKLYVDLGITLAPLDSIHVEGVSTNQEVQEVTFFWTERTRRT